MNNFVLVIGLTLFFSGIYNCIILSKKNILCFLVASEIMFLGLDVLFVFSSILFNHGGGLIMGILTLMLTVGESVVGLGLCVTSLKINKNINFDEYTTLQC